MKTLFHQAWAPIALTVLVCFAGLSMAFGQSKNITTQHIYWTKIGVNLDLPKEWKWVGEVENRRFFHPDVQHQLLFRTHLHHPIGANWWASAGFTYFLQYPHNPKETNRLIVPELRPHQEIYYRQRVSDRFQIQHHYRVEQRFFRNTDQGELAQGYNFNWRFRYRLGFQWNMAKVGKQHPISLLVFDEIMFNAGKQIVLNPFDQNRVYAGFKYDFSTHNSLEIGYMNWFQQRSKGVDYYNRHIVRVQYVIKFNTQKKQIEEKQG